MSHRGACVPIVSYKFYTTLFITVDMLSLSTRLRYLFNCVIFIKFKLHLHQIFDISFIQFSHIMSQYCIGSYEVNRFLR